MLLSKQLVLLLGTDLLDYIRKPHKDFTHYGKILMAYYRHPKQQYDHLIKADFHPNRITLLGFRTNNTQKSKETIMKITASILAIAMAAGLTTTLSGCATSSAVTGAGVGAAGGYAAGRATGDHSDKRARQGAILGAIGGYIAGNEADKAKQNHTTYQQPQPTYQAPAAHSHQGGHVHHRHHNGVAHTH